MTRWLTIFALLSSLGWAQNTSSPPLTADSPTFGSVTFPVYSQNPVPVPGGSIAVVGQPGQATWYFWASANFQLGSVLSFLGAIQNAPNTLTSGNYVSIIPTGYPAGASSVDILATSTPVAPSGACNCAVATGLTSGGANFQSNTLLSYTVSVLNPSSFNLVLRNEVTGSGVTSLVLRNAYTGALVCNLSTGCGSGSGTVQSVASGTGLTGGPITSTGTLNIAANYQLPQTCAVNQIPVWTGTTPPWGCATGGTGNVNTVGSLSQNIVQAVGTYFSADNLAFFRYVVPSWNWAQTDVSGSIGNLTTPGSNTLTLTPCPKGIDTASASHNYIYRVYISGTGTAEADTVTSGTCPPGATSGTVVITTLNAHAAGFTVGSSTSGIQEAYNDAWVSDGCSSAPSCAAPAVQLSADTDYNIYSSVYLRGRGGQLDGSGSILHCYTRDRCVFIGSPPSGIGYHRVRNLFFTPQLNIAGVNISSVCAGASCSPAQSNGTYLFTTATNHPFVVGDTVCWEVRSQTYGSRSCGNATISNTFTPAPITSVPSPTTFTLTIGSTQNFAVGTTTFGWVDVMNAAIEDDSDHVDMYNVQIFQTSATASDYFSFGIIDDNDQALEIYNAANRSSPVVRGDSTWPIGAFVYGRFDNGNASLVHIRGGELTNINCYTGGGNGLVYADSVCQTYPDFGIRYDGGLVPATISNIYTSSGATNQLFGGLQANMGVWLSGGSRIIGNFPIISVAPTFTSGGSAANQLNYFVQPIASQIAGTPGTYYGPMYFIGRGLPTNGSVTVNTLWTSIELQDAVHNASIGNLTWNLYSTTGTTTVPPYGTGTFLVAGGITGSCGVNGMCGYADTQAARTSVTIPVQTFDPAIWMTPAAYVTNGTITLDNAATNPYVIAQQGINVSTPSLSAMNCGAGGVLSERTPALILCGTSDNINQATLIPTTDGQPTQSKGRLNLGPYQNCPNDWITGYDSNSSKTFATPGMRPSNDAGDTAIGCDFAGGLALRASVIISSYINTVADNASELERLSASAKTFFVPVTTPGAMLALSTTAIAANTCAAAQTVTLTGLTTGSVVKWSYASTPIGVTGYGTGALWVQTFATANTANFVVCNITASSVTPGTISVNVREEN